MKDFNIIKTEHRKPNIVPLADMLGFDTKVSSERDKFTYRTEYILELNYINRFSVKDEYMLEKALKLARKDFANKLYDDFKQKLFMLEKALIEEDVENAFSALSEIYKELEGKCY